MMNTQEFDEKVKELTLMVIPFVAPLFLLPSASAQPDQVINNGSAALVDTGAQKLLITCNHVWSEFMDYLKTNPEGVVALGAGYACPPIRVETFPLIDSVISLDVAVVGFSMPSLLRGSKKQFCVSTPWPPARPQKDDVIITVGWPGVNRRPTADRRNLLFRSTTIVDFVVSASDRHLVLADLTNQRCAVAYQEDVTADGPLGGMSGCPAFVNRNKRLEFIGTLYEAGDGVQATVFISHAGYIKVDGTIDCLALPA